MRFYFTWLILIFACSISAQEKLEDLSFYIEQHSDKLAAGRNSSSGDLLDYKAPWIDRMEFRTETRDWELVQQEYQFRLRPNTPKVRKYQKQVYQDLLTELEATKAAVKTYGLKKVYENWLEKIFEDRRADLLVNSRSYYDDLVKVLSSTNQKGEIDALEIIEVKIEREELELKIKNLQKDLANPDIQNSLLSIEDIKGKILIDSDNPGLYPSIASDLFDLQKIENKYALEKAEKNKAFEFAQVTYRGPHDEIWQERISMSLAFRIPRGERTNFDMLELQIDKMMEQEQIAERKLDYQNSLGSATEDLQEAIDAYDEKKEMIAQLAKYGDILEKYNPSTKGEIVKLISLKMDAMDGQLDLLRLEENIYERYIDYLDARSIFSTQPTISHLTK